MLVKKRKTEKKQKTAKQMERHLKGVANHRRIEILYLISENEDITLDGICEALKGNTKTISEHTKKLAQAGLVNKNYKGRGVNHTLSPYGQRFIKFIKTF
jgi:DNA-binding MarR family transcriptional regulator